MPSLGSQIATGWKNQRLNGIARGLKPPTSSSHKNLMFIMLLQYSEKLNILNFKNALLQSFERSFNKDGNRPTS